MDERITRVEHLIARLDAEVSQARRQLELAQARARRATRRGRIAMTCAAVALVTVPTVAASAGTGPRPLTVQAPFTVVDASGAPLLTVTRNGLTVLANRKPVVRLSGQLRGGAIDWFNSNLKGGGSLGISSDGSGAGYVAISGLVPASDKSPGDRAILGSKNQKLGLRIFNDQQAAPLAAIAETDGGGAVVINAPDGKQLAYLGPREAGAELQLFSTKSASEALIGIGNSGNALAEVFAPGGQAVGQLIADSGAGHLLINDSKPSTRVEVGVTSDDRGVVSLTNSSGAANDVVAPKNGARG